MAIRLYRSYNFKAFQLKLIIINKNFDNLFGITISKKQQKTS